MLVKRLNPFFLGETVRTLVETGALAGERGGYRLTRRVDALQIPATVRAILAARIVPVGLLGRHAERDAAASAFIR